MSRRRVLRVLLAVIVSITAVGVIAFDTEKVARLSGNLTSEVGRVGRLTDRLVAVQHGIAVTQKASTSTRVFTVTQRCKLTGLILGVLVRVQDQADAAPFQASRATCLRQLAAVKAINDMTPEP